LLTAINNSSKYAFKLIKDKGWGQNEVGQP
jgi:hypothetical protein